MVRRIVAVLICLAVSGWVLGCKAEKKSPLTEPSRNQGPILSIPTESKPVEDAPTPVYATVFGDTVILATYPVETWGEDQNGQPAEPECSARSVSGGGRIACGGEHESETPIVKVIILERIAPESTREWFKGMSSLSVIQGIEKLDVQFVEDMAEMFAGCEALRELPQWYEE